MKYSTSDIIKALEVLGYTAPITGNTTTGFFHKGKLLTNAVYERFFVCCGFTDQLEVIVKVTSACGTIKGIALY
jgi:hypothetical protein